MGAVKQTEQGAYLTLDPEKTKGIMSALEAEIKKIVSSAATLIFPTGGICIIGLAV